MQNEILDEVVGKDNYPKYGLKAYSYFLKTLTCFLCLIFVIPVFGKHLTFGLHRQIETVLVLAIIIFLILGLRNNFISNRLNEKTETKSQIGEIGNVIFLVIFILLFFLFIFPLLVELTFN